MNVTSLFIRGSKANGAPPPPPVVAPVPVPPPARLGLVPEAIHVPSVTAVSQVPLTEILRDGAYVNITPELAARIAVECVYEKQRPIGAGRLNYIVSGMKRGIWNPGRQMSFAIMPDGTLYLVNGQHRGKAIVVSGISLAYMIEVVPCQDMAAVHKLYASYDVGGAERDLLETAGGLLDHDLNRPQLCALYRAVQIIDVGFRKVNRVTDAPKIRSHIERTESVAEWVGTAERYFALIGSATRQVRQALYRQPVMAAALMTLQSEPEIAEEFWGGLAKDDGLRCSDPRKCLQEKLRNPNPDYARSVPAQLQTVAVAWNRFYEGGKLNARYQVPIGKPLTLAGTRVVNRSFSGEKE